MGHMDLPDLMLPMLGLKYIFLKAKQDYDIFTYIDKELAIKMWTLNWAIGWRYCSHKWHEVLVKPKLIFTIESLLASLNSMSNRQDFWLPTNRCDWQVDKKTFKRNHMSTRTSRMIWLKSRRNSANMFYKINRWTTQLSSILDLTSSKVCCEWYGI